MHDNNDNSTSNILSGDDETVLFIEYDNKSRGVFLHTSKGKQFYQGSFSFWVLSFNNRGFKFEKADRNIAVNASEIEEIFKDKWNVSVSFGEKHNKRTCYISETYHKHLKKSGMLEKQSTT